jgi:hypothetical protein
MDHLVALGLSSLIIAGSLTLATAEDRPSVGTKPARTEDRPSAGTKPAREKFAKLLLADGSPKNPTAKRRGVVVNAFSSTRVIIK